MADARRSAVRLRPPRPSQPAVQPSSRPSPSLSRSLSRRARAPWPLAGGCISTAHTASSAQTGVAGMAACFTQHRPGMRKLPVMQSCQARTGCAAECGAPVHGILCAPLKISPDAQPCKRRATDASRRAPGKSNSNINNNDNNTNTTTNNNHRQCQCQYQHLARPLVSRRDAMRMVWDTWCPWPSSVHHLSVIPVWQLGFHYRPSRAQGHQTIHRSLSADAARETCPAYVSLSLSLPR